MPNLEQYVESNAEVATLLASNAGHQTVATRLSEVGVKTSERSVRRYRNKVGWSPDNVLDVSGIALASEGDKDDQIEELKAANRRLYKQYAKMKKSKSEYLARIYEAVQDSRDALDPPLPVPAPNSDKRQKRKEEAAIWHLTDWQGGKKTASYDMDTMDKRVEVFTTKAAELTGIMRADHPVRHCTILLGGDMVEGVSIFPGQVWELDGTLFDQIFRVSDRISWAIKQALQIYETVEVVGEWGNHGRIGKKGDGIKASDNVDRIVYEICKRNLEHEPRLVDFKIWDKWYQHFTIGNYAALLVHGDEIKGFGGNVPAYGILRKSNSWASGVVPTFRDVYIGHFHQSMELQLANGGSVYMSGSIESDNEYAREFVAAASKPSQRLHFVDPEAGRVTYESKIWVTE